MAESENKSTTPSRFERTYPEWWDHKSPCLERRNKNKARREKIKLRRMTKFLAKLKELGIVISVSPEKCSIRRTFAGYWQRSSGAWSWELYINDDGERTRSIGSQYTFEDILKAKTLEVSRSDGGTTLFPGKD